jgi:hypothetical protein
MNSSRAEKSFRYIEFEVAYGETAAGCMATPVAEGAAEARVPARRGTRQFTSAVTTRRCETERFRGDCHHGVVPACPIAVLAR